MELLTDFGGCAARKVSQKDIADSNTDICIYVIARQAGEGVDRRAQKGDLYLTDEEYADIKLCAENALCMTAGNDLIMPGGKTEKKDIIKAVKDKTISEHSVKRCCANVIKYIFDSHIQKEYIDTK